MLLPSFTDTKPLVFIFSLNSNKFFTVFLSNSRSACLVFRIFSFINLAADVLNVVGRVAVVLEDRYCGSKRKT